jgi:hypothetical protein
VQNVIVFVTIVNVERSAATVRAPELADWALAHGRSALTTREVAVLLGVPADPARRRFTGPHIRHRKLFQVGVNLFLKLPSAFKVPTPLGPYNPDWAAIVERDGLETLYLVVETKGTNDKSKLREAERQNIDSATRHFEAIRVENGFVNLIYPDHPVVTIEDVESYLDAMPAVVGSTS